jgi:hypothetical protein
LNGYGIRGQALADLFYDTQEIGAGTIHLVDENQARYFVLVALPPDCFGLRFNATDRTEHRYRTVKYAQAAFDFDREIDMSGRIDNVDAVLFELLVHALPETGGSSGRNSDTAFLLLLHPVHDGSAVMNFTYLVRNTGVKKDALCRRGLTGIDMRHDADIAVTFDGCCSGHALISKNPGCSVRRPVLPAVVRERFVGFGHTMGVFFLLDRGATILGRVEQLMCQTVCHRFLAALACGLDNPAHGERLAACRTNFDRYLVGGTADAAGFHLDHWLHIIQSRVQ